MQSNLGGTEDDWIDLIIIVIVCFNFTLVLQYLGKCGTLGIKWKRHFPFPFIVNGIVHLCYITFVIKDCKCCYSTQYILTKAWNS